MPAPLSPDRKRLRGAALSGNMVVKAPSPLIQHAGNSESRNLLDTLFRSSAASATRSQTAEKGPDEAPYASNFWSFDSAQNP